MALGEQLRLARMKRKATASEVAAGTRMKVQIVEALEREDFSEMAAPIYAKGFIRLYAEFVGLDPAPLIQEYMLKGSDGAAPSLQPESGTSPTPITVPDPEPEPPTDDLFATEDDVEDAPVPEPEETEPVTTGPQPSMLHDRTPRPSKAALGGKAAGAWGKISETTAGAWAACTSSLKSVGDRVKQSGLKIDLSGLKITESPTRAISAGIGVLVVLLFVISSLSRCIRKPDDELPPTDNTELHLAVPPPDPYVD